MSGINFWDLLRSQIINVPVTNFIGLLYMILNVALLMFGTFFGEDSFTT